MPKSLLTQQIAATWMKQEAICRIEGILKVWKLSSLDEIESINIILTQELCDDNLI